MDGDTLDVLLSGRPTRIRLAGIDAPGAGQAYGTRARQFTGAQAFGKLVQVHTVGSDRYGRLLAYVVLPNGRTLNQELVAAATPGTTLAIRVIPCFMDWSSRHGFGGEDSGPTRIPFLLGKIGKGAGECCNPSLRSLASQGTETSALTL